MNSEKLIRFRLIKVDNYEDVVYLTSEAGILLQIIKYEGEEELEEYPNEDWSDIYDTNDLIVVSWSYLFRQTKVMWDTKELESLDIV